MKKARGLFGILIVTILLCMAFFFKPFIAHYYSQSLGYDKEEIDEMWLNDSIRINFSTSTFDTIRPVKTH
jgi:hypothetical protein